ncbi:ABC transporter substrate-binding protein [Nakamurella aerolata]|uniref:Extracellular solute-binding protein n=1 Tax=Nakamurella aerolata TaxID=1656892 RepID=A0A849A9U0_9ACTN|nr:extracellular solute-binding protein [Nakamurella aerolata]NNG36376.1 extracellular solute-binding protein [Nakamurella aerolata]
MRTAPLGRFAVTATVFALITTGCATGSGNSDSSAVAKAFGSTSAAPSGQLRVMGFGADDEIGSTRLALAKKALPGVTVSLVEGDLDIQAFLSAVAAGDPPELVYANRDQIGTFASRGAVLPLDACISSQGIAVDQIAKPAIAQVTFNKQVYAVPEFNMVQIVMANSDLLGKAGVQLSQLSGQDWPAITSATKKLTASSGGKLSVIGYDSKLPEFLPLWAHSNGADLLSADGRKAQLNDPKVVEALTFANGVYQAQGGFAKVKAYRDAADFFGKENQYATGTLGAMPMEQWYVNVLNEMSPKAPLAFTPFVGKDGKPVAFASGSAWAIPAGSKNAAAACTFIKTMTAVDSWMAAAKARADARAKDKLLFTGLLTGNKTADEKIRSTFVKPSGVKAWDDAVKATYLANDNTFSLPANPADAEFKTAWQDAVNRVLNGQQQPKPALDAAQQQAQAALDKAWAAWDAKK